LQLGGLCITINITNEKVYYSFATSCLCAEALQRSDVESIPESNEIIADSSTAKQDSNIPPLPTVNSILLRSMKQNLEPNYAVMQLKLIQQLKSAYDKIEIILRVLLMLMPEDLTRADG
jgi:hypothetical protein